MQDPRARPVQSLACVVHAATAVVALFVASPLAGKEPGLEAELQGRSPLRFCLKNLEPSGESVCFTLNHSHTAPPADPEVFKAQQEKLQAELHRRAEDARRRLREIEERKQRVREQPP